MSNFMYSLNNKKLYDAKIENLDAFRVKKHYSQVIEVINSSDDIKVVKKELSNRNKGKSGTFLFTTD